MILRGEEEEEEAAPCCPPDPRHLLSSETNLDSDHVSLRGSESLSSARYVSSRYLYFCLSVILVLLLSRSFPERDPNTVLVCDNMCCNSAAVVLCRVCWR